jgi:2-methylcitrate dehydratase PrpD
VNSSRSINREFADWISTLTLTAIPSDVLADTKRRIADVVGLMFAGSTTLFGRNMYAGLAKDRPGSCTVIGQSGLTTPENAALINGACAHVLEFDDTHLETAIHVSTPVVAAAIATAETTKASGNDIVTAVAAASELSCRLGLISPGAFHAAGYHPTAIFGAFSSAYAAARLSGLRPDIIKNSTGIVASQSAGLMASWVDGTDAKSTHGGWSAHCGMMAVKMAAAGVSGPDLAIEGPYGIFRTHVKDAAFAPNFDRATEQLGEVWESRNISYKPYPAGHFVHAFVDALLHVMRNSGLHYTDIDSIVCPTAPHMVQMICEPVEQKLSPASSWHCRVSLQWSVAEAAVLGRLDRHAYDLTRTEVPAIRELAHRVRYTVNTRLTDRSVWQGQVIITTNDGHVFDYTEAQNRGSRENPLSENDIRHKFLNNVEGILTRRAAEELYDRILQIDRYPSIDQLFQRS